MSERCHDTAVRSLAHAVPLLPMIDAAKVVILDRDGVVNFDSDAYVKSPAEWRAIPGSIAAVARLNRAGYRVAIATNQSGVGRGLFARETLDRIHARMHAALAEGGARIDVLACCPHAPDAGCDCRKPRPGLLRQIADALRVDLRGVPFVGDTLADVQAALAVGAHPILVRTGKGERSLADPRLPADVPVFADLASFTDAFLAAA